MRCPILRAGALGMNITMNIKSVLGNEHKNYYYFLYDGKLLLEASLGPWC